MLKVKPKYLLSSCWALNDPGLHKYMYSSSTMSSGMHKNEIKDGLNNHHLSFQICMNSNIIFDMHIGVEEKVMIYRKLSLLDKW